MGKKSTTATPLKNRLEGRVFWMSGKFSYPTPESITNLIERCGGTVVHEPGPGVTDVISNSVSTQTTQKLVAQLSKKNGTPVVLTDGMEVVDLLNLTEGDLIPLLAAGESELWNLFSGCLNKKIKLADVDLKNRDLSSFIFDGCDLRGANLEGCTMTQYQFRDVNGAVLDSAKFNQSELAQLRSCSFKKASFTECTFSDSISDCNFSMASLTRADAGYAKFSNCDFSGCDLKHAELDRTEFKNCNFSKSDLSVSSMLEVDLRKANLSKASFHGAMLMFAKLDNATLVGVDFRDAVLCGVSFKGADLTGSDFTGAATGGANFGGAKMTDVVGLNVERKSIKPKAKENLSKFEEAVKKIPNFFGGIEVKLNGVRIGLLIKTFKSLPGAAFGSIDVRGGGGLRAEEYKSISDAMIELAQTFHEGVLDLDTVHAIQPPKSKVDLKRLATAAWCEAMGVVAPTEDELRNREEEKAANAQRLLHEILTELKGGPKGIEKWNVRRQKKGEIVSLQGQDFSKTDFAGAVLDGVDLRDCNFNAASFKQVSMQSIDVTGSSFVDANLEKVNATSANLENADFSKSKMAGANLHYAWLENANFNGADLTGCNFSCTHIEGTDLSSAILDKTNFHEAEYDQETKFPHDFEPAEEMIWQGKGVNPFLVAEAKRQTSGTVDFESFLQSLRKDFDHERMKKVLKMLKEDRFQLFADVTDEAVSGIVKSQTDSELFYSCRLASDGSFACCTQNTNSCGGLRGALCKHILVLVVALSKSEKITTNKALEWVLLSKGHQPKLDKNLMAETFIRYKGSEAGEIDWRPMETVPEDYYAF